MGSLGSNHFDVIVVGAGPVGLLTAINLASRGVKAAVLERGHGIDQSPRATSYQPCVMAEMEETGILEDVKKKAMVNNILSFWKGPKERVAYVEKLEGGDVFPAGLNCGQPVLAEIILNHLLTRYEAQVIFDKKVEELQQSASKVTAVCSSQANGAKTTYTCDWLVGANGAGSSVRKLLGIGFEGFSWPKEDFVATNLRYPFQKHGFTTANFVMDDVNWAVITVIDNTGLWRCAFGVKAGLTNEQIRAELDEHYRHILPGWPGEGYEIVQLNRYKPHQRCATQFRKGRCFLAGDAAHSNNPIGGLGLTTGLLDGGPLGRALAAVISGKAPESILDTWAESRRHTWKTFTNEFSIENKRMIQLGGYSEDPLGIWKLDEVSKAHGIDEWIEKLATPQKKEADLAMYKALEDKQAQLASRMKQWNITMDPLWMAQYEDPEVIKLRSSLRPAGAKGSVPAV
ncbi:FAD/NAD(P)-binding domain-containing protein [Hyaloscypha hepaticicola]|uniref:FAD/NAD(P)-binding domain-containing protein n=1 Tax=Hyaloscypha hepaticicola TaxID=2082293 RepID=A0A2J6QH07_9HELO|nr:FAD/NAD(P)-binding domain-containing protein [Hyaloscypha hepaticicola]